MILEDTRMKMQSWGAAGTFDPFDKIYEVSLALLFVCAGHDRLFFLDAIARLSNHHSVSF